MTGEDTQITKSAKPVTRRQFLGLVWMGALSLGMLKLVEVFGRVLIPRRPKGKYGSEIEAGTVGELPNTVAAPLAYPEGRFWLVNTETGVLALHRACTHLDCLVSWDDTAGKFVCPCHGSEFERDGTCLQGPATRNLDRYPVQVVTVEGEVIAQTSPDGQPLLIQTEDDSTPLDATLLVDTGVKIFGHENG
jgi:cytochrome b6-f complex iron-sulfur subunit